MKEVEEFDIDREEITTITFNDLLSKHDLPTIDFLQIDTEGYDERILNIIDFGVLEIKFIKFEKHYLSEGFIENFINKLEVLCFFLLNFVILSPIFLKLKSILEVY